MTKEKAAVSGLTYPHRAHIYRHCRNNRGACDAKFRTDLQPRCGVAGQCTIVFPLGARGVLVGKIRGVP